MSENYVIVHGRSVIDNKLFKFEISLNKKFKGTIGEQVFVKLSKYVEKYYSKTVKVFGKDLREFCIDSSEETGGKVKYKNRVKNEKFYSALIKEAPACSLAYNTEYRAECEKEWSSADSLKALKVKMNETPMIIGFRDWLKITRIQYVSNDVIIEERNK